MRGHRYELDQVSGKPSDLHGEYIETGHFTNRAKALKAARDIAKRNAFNRCEVRELHYLGPKVLFSWTRAA